MTARTLTKCPGCGMPLGLTADRCGGCNRKRSGRTKGPGGRSVTRSLSLPGNVDEMLLQLMRDLGHSRSRVVQDLISCSYLRGAA